MQRDARNFLLQLLWGGLIGGLFGAARTLAAARHLAAKNTALLAAGLPALPGNGHLESLAGSDPGWAGALFFGLSLGLGFATVCFLWGRFLHSLPREALGIGAAALAVFPLFAVFRGEVLLAATLVAIAVGAGALGWKSAGVGNGWLLALGAVAIALGFSTWSEAPEGGFTRLRDQYLLKSSAGRAVNDFYYRWTLYPAEAIKPFMALTQPVALLGDREATPQQVEKLRRDLLRTRILTLPEETEGADLRIVNQGGKLLIAAGKTTLAWPVAAKAQDDALLKLSSMTDTAKMLRRMTAYSLAVGCPIAAALLLCYPLRALSSLIPRRRNLLFLTLAAAMGVALAAAGRSTEETERRNALMEGKASATEMQAALTSPDPADRIYGLAAAGRDAPANKAALLAALEDPVPNVRHTAALALGALSDADVREALLDIVNGQGLWYIKDRAYLALIRGGWRPK